MVFLERVQNLAQAALHQLNVLHDILFIQVHLSRIAGIDLILDAVHAGHHHRREGQVWVRARVGAAELDALAIR